MANPDGWQCQQIPPLALPPSISGRRETLIRPSFASIASEREFPWVMVVFTARAPLVFSVVFVTCIKGTHGAPAAPCTPVFFFSFCSSTERIFASMSATASQPTAHLGSVFSFTCTPVEAQTTLLTWGRPDQSLLSPTPVKESTDSCNFCHHCQPTWGLSFFLSLFVITPAHRPLIFSVPRKLLLSTWPGLPGSRLPRPPSISTRGV
jgi:hypothetical protein